MIVACDLNEIVTAADYKIGILNGGSAGLVSEELAALVTGPIFLVTVIGTGRKCCRVVGRYVSAELTCDEGFSTLRSACGTGLIIYCELQTACRSHKILINSVLYVAMLAGIATLEGITAALAAYTGIIVYCR